MWLWGESWAYFDMWTSAWGNSQSGRPVALVRNLDMELGRWARKHEQPVDLIWWQRGYRFWSIPFSTNESGWWRAGLHYFNDFKGLSGQSQFLLPALLSTKQVFCQGPDKSHFSLKTAWPSAKSLPRGFPQCERNTCISWEANPATTRHWALSH